MIYFDHAATSPLNQQVLETYTKLLSSSFANSESTYDLGTQVSLNLQKARAHCASFFGVKEKDILFTSGASESNNMAIKSIALAYQEKGKHIISTNVEHSSVLGALKQLEELFGFDITYLPVNQQGSITTQQVLDALREDTILVSVMAVNNEVGSINPVNQIAKSLKKHPALFHVDGVQAVNKIDLNYADFDLCSVSAHKLGGLKGSGILIKKEHLKFEPLISGGAQEFHQRGGTVDALTQIMFYKTLKLNLEQDSQSVKQINQYLRQELDQIHQVVIHSPKNASDYILSFSVLGLTSEMMANALAAQQIYVSYRSTCHNRDAVGSIVLKAMGVSDDCLSSVLRLSFSHTNTLSEAKQFIESLKGIIQQYGTR